MKTIKTPKEDTLRGTGYGSLGWTEGGRMYKTAKRMEATFDDSDVRIGAKKEGVKKIEVFCSCCKASFKVVEGKGLPKHIRTTSTNVPVYEDGKFVKYNVVKESFECTGEVVVIGKTIIETHKLPFVKKFGNINISISIDVKAGDNLIIYCTLYDNIRKYQSAKYNRPSDVIPYESIEKTVKQIVRTHRKNRYGYNSGFNEIITIHFTDGTTDKDYHIKDAVII